MRSIGPAVTREQSPAFLRNSNGRLDFPGPTQEASWIPPQRRQWHPTPVLLPGKSHGRRSLVGCSPWGRYESDTTERLHFHFSLSCIGEGNGTPLQCSCLENPRDGGAWWAAVYGVTQSRTQLKWLSSSSSSKHILRLNIKRLRNTATCPWGFQRALKSGGQCVEESFFLEPRDAL